MLPAWSCLRSIGSSRDRLPEHIRRRRQGPRDRHVRRPENVREKCIGLARMTGRSRHVPIRDQAFRSRLTERTTSSGTPTARFARVCSTRSPVTAERPSQNRCRSAGQTGTRRGLTSWPGPTRRTIVWKEFDGEKTSVNLITSTDAGKTWSQPRVIASHLRIFGSSLVGFRRTANLFILDDEGRRLSSATDRGRVMKRMTFVAMLLLAGFYATSPRSRRS